MMTHRAIGTLSRRLMALVLSVLAPPRADSFRPTSTS